MTERERVKEREELNTEKERQRIIVRQKEYTMERGLEGERWTERDRQKTKTDR